jgi:hypothetical protein
MSTSEADLEISANPVSKGIGFDATSVCGRRMLQAGGGIGYWRSTLWIAPGKLADFTKNC